MPKVYRGSPYKKDVTPVHPLIIVGDRDVSKVALTSHFALFRGVPMSAEDIGVRLNCPPRKVLAAVLQLEAEGSIMRHDVDGAATEKTRWVMP